MHSLALLALAPAIALAAPAVVSRASSSTITVLDAAQLQEFTPFAFFAAAAYCDTRLTTNWSCGPNCEGVADFIPTATGGDGSLVQFWFVGYYPQLNSVVVGHQGTKPANILPLLTDANFILEKPDEDTFPGLAAAGVMMHNGFHDQHQLTYGDILPAVQQTMADYNTTSVILAGHSLGAALSVLDGIALKIAMPDASFRIATFGQPRLGNKAFADYVDAHFPGTIRMTNKRDLVPTIPGRFLGYAHFSGEVHIKSDDSIVLCHGQDNTGCIIKDVPSIFSGDVTLHKGPYLGVIMKCPANDNIPAVVAPPTRNTGTGSGSGDIVGDILDVIGNL
ncbi:lipase class 3 family protein [Exidia glandulosa HHB12029]|uniref:Lipase class 3 family protein n=1 Tax=Exidia glandulosa HHB12029 TaxID=1314781 RepID=A0A165N0P4_EXIGL|nr:lipase class 3 family protein [Exidia glandulosa HHB12029]